jgi:hypothetical protein
VNSFIHFSIAVTGGAAGVIAVAWLIRWSLRKAKNRPRALMGAAWALLFFTSGRMPPPPPQSQIEEEDSEKKNREIGRGDST